MFRLSVNVAAGIYKEPAAAIAKNTRFTSNGPLAHAVTAAKPQRLYTYLNTVVK